MTIYSEELGKVQLYHDIWNIIIGVGTDDIYDKYVSLQNIYAGALYHCYERLKRFELNIMKSTVQPLDKHRNFLKAIVKNRFVYSIYIAISEIQMYEMKHLIRSQTN